jgi:hypothetical protein
MKQHALAIFYGLLIPLLLPALAMAQDDDSKYHPDARLEGYATSVSTGGATTALTWLLLVFLGVICFSVLFKNAKRTHLD